MGKEVCAICRSECASPPYDHGRKLSCECVRCGKYTIVSGITLGVDGAPLDIGLVSGWIRNENSSKREPHIDRETVKMLSTLQRPGFKERVERYISAAAKQAPALGGQFDIYFPALIAESYSSSQEELEFITKHLTDQGYIEGIGVDKSGKVFRNLTAKGRMAADELRSQRTKTSQGFIAMSFAEEMLDAYKNGFHEGVRKAGYKPMRIDGKHHINDITDEIIAEIRRSAFVVADLTGKRNGVYFEAGFAFGLNTPVIWTCRKDEMDERHFDIRQYNCIGWETPEELANVLQLRIEAVLGAGPIPVTPTD